MTPEIERRKAIVQKLVEGEMPNFQAMIDNAEKKKALVILHQDAYAADWQLDELILLGSAIKCAGEKGLEIRIIGKNRETID